MAVTSPEKYDREARRLETLLPAGPRLAVLGSTDFWHPDSERTCAELGRLLADIAGLVLLTGGVEGIGEAVGRSFDHGCRAAGRESRVYHILPEGEQAWDYGQTLFAGSDMTERREILGRLAGLYLMVEGGPRAGHEAEVGGSRGAVVIPVGRSGGYAATLYTHKPCPAAIDAATWATLGRAEASPAETAEAALRAVRSCLAAPGTGAAQ